MLEVINWSPYLFEVGLLLIDSLLIGSLLVNSEAAYNLIQSDITQLEKCHESSLRALLELPLTTPKPMLYLFTGSIPICHRLQQRRLIYLHHIINQSDKSL